MYVLGFFPVLTSGVREVKEGGGEKAFQVSCYKQQRSHAMGKKNKKQRGGDFWDDFEQDGKEELSMYLQARQLGEN